jgi:hypothetical protein
MRRMLRTLLCALAVVACSNNPSTGPAQLESCTSTMPIATCTNGTVTAKSAWIETTHVGYTVNGMPMNYLGWLLRYTSATPGTECTNNITAATTIKIVTTQVESSTVTRAVFMPEQVTIVPQVPDQPPSIDVAIVSTSDTSAVFTSGSLSITTDKTCSSNDLNPGSCAQSMSGVEKNLFGEIDGSINATGTYSGGDIALTGDFYAHKCFL